MSAFDVFEKKNDYIVCIDSDGCAMDTMNIKHIRCFGPCMVSEWKLDNWRDDILDRWNDINLYSKTRGINRFKGLAMMLLEVNEKYCPIDGIKALVTWADEAPELSNDSVEKMILVNDIFRKALNWSKAVNESIEALPKEEIKPFEGVKDAIERIHENCDIAVVSSANPEAVKAEWERFGLLINVDIICTQDMGSKAYCISEIAKKGYKLSNILMCGDAVGDMNAAKTNGVLYYPIKVNHEKESWNDLKEKALESFINGSFSGDYQDSLIRDFLDNLNA